MRIALVHDFLMQRGGAERVLAALASRFPDAPIYTLLYDAQMTDVYLPGRDIRASFLQKLPRWIRTRYRFLFPLMPYAASRLPVGEFDLIISSSSAFAKGVRRGTHAVHVCYCHAPSRFLWDDRRQYQKDNRFHFFTRLMITVLIYPLQIWDVKTAERVDIWIANSKTTQERIRRLYHKPSAVVYPPILQLKRHMPRIKKDGGYFLVVSRLSAYKRIDAIVDAFSMLTDRLVVVGTGREEERLRARAGKNISFAGFVSDEDLAEYYAGCTAFIVACDDDFGMSAVEALSFGKPVIAYKKGGVTEWMEEGETGEFFDTQTPEAVRDAVHTFIKRKKEFDPAYMKKRAEEFSEKRFYENIMRLIPR
ncbi:hypothetical protein A2Z10_01350 [Candidatus Azambacteria bacterium RBG_16_47_10]|uniref:Glycosyl transferase family 1 domain-containing protein n=1 Tax=Candidatus Azambacteria bacterium RBG_16_47_10 TaxID=1797292 RepID=A0A1F5AYD7_9BACT|nr:MAG: hypothetical protein A2Z10_01350 [Candidatus Azambacteria bacterium RBG_16_47_10]